MSTIAVTIGRSAATALMSALAVTPLRGAAGQETPRVDPLAARALEETGLPIVTLDEALRRAARVDPALTSARGDVATAVSARRATIATLFLPSVSMSGDGQRYSAPAFNPGTLQPAATVVTGQLQASYELFTGGRRLADLRRARTELASAEAGETSTRFATALQTTTDYYAVIGERELARVARDRARRAEEQLAIARARVIAGAVVQTDSLQQVLELTRARVALLERGAALRVARLQLGRRVGTEGPVDAALADTSLPPALPLSAADAAHEAVARGPDYVAARAQERAAEAAVSAERSAYLPRLTVNAATATFDERFIPDAAQRSQVGVTLSFPIWDNGTRGLAVARARAARDNAQATRADLERGAGQAATQATEAYATARASIDLAAQGVAVARETYRVQRARYGSGATTVLDVVQAQEALTQAEADLVDTRQRARLALARLESLLGRRLFPGA
jgi:outer membrane protein TolC